MPKEIKTKQKQNRKIRQVDKKNNYKSYIIRNFKKHKQDIKSQEKEDENNERKYATDIVQNTTKEISKKTAYKLANVYKKKRRKLKKEENEDDEQEDTDDSNQDEHDINNEPNGKKINDENTSEHKHYKSKTNTRNSVKNENSNLNHEDNRKLKIKEFQKQSYIKTRENAKNQNLVYQNNVASNNSNAIRFKRRNNDTNAKIKVKNSSNSSNLINSTNQENVKKNFTKKYQTQQVIKKADKTKENSKKITKAVLNTGKTVVNELKGILMLLGAGGAFLMIIIIIISLIGGLISSSFGIFFSNQAISEISPNNISIGNALEILEQEVDDKIEEIKSEIDNDTVVVNKGDIYWKDIVIVYAVLTTNRDKDANITVMNEENLEKLRKIFWEVVDVDYEVSTYYVIHVYTKNGQQVREREARTRLEIKAKCMTFDEMMGHYGFSVSEHDQAIELQKEEYDELWYSIL